VRHQMSPLVHFRNNRFSNPEAAARKCLRPFAWWARFHCRKISGWLTYNCITTIIATARKHATTVRTLSLVWAKRISDSDMAGLLLPASDSRVCRSLSSLYQGLFHASSPPTRPQRRESIGTFRTVAEGDAPEAGATRYFFSSLSK
jgi:hypothetical protein